METATLRIKFQPLLQEVDKGESNCCLEIVPQVTAANDIKRIRWALDDDLVEYTVPMTYKIIIRKEKKRKMQVNSNSSTSIKVYHSCVDLLHSYSVINTDAECGDVQRIISDNFFLMRLKSSVDHFRSCKAQEKKIDIRTPSSSVHRLVQDASVLCQLPGSTPTFHKEADNGDSNKLGVNKATSYDKVCNIECDIAVVDYNKEIGGEANKLPTPTIYTSSADGNVGPEPEASADNGTHSESNRKLTMSAVYSFDTSNVIDLTESVDSYAEDFTKEYVIEMKDVSTLQMSDDSVESRKANAVKIADQNVTRALMSVFDGTTSPMAIWNKRKIKISRSLNTEYVINKDEEKKSKLETSNKQKAKSSSIFRINNSCNTNKKSVSSLLSNGFDIFDQFKPKNMCVNEDSIITKIEAKRSSLIYRPTVESRVAKYTALMEKEILPLKFKLNDIRNKCLSLGILFPSHEKSMPSNDTLLYKNVNNPYLADMLHQLKKKNQKHSDTRVTKFLKTDTNRFVYSMVFNG